MATRPKGAGYKSRFDFRPHTDSDEPTTGTLKELLAEINYEYRPATGTEIKRSEEHKSELQSLMRISYAVFCLKKKKTTKRQLQKHNNINILTDNNNIRNHSS